MKCVKCGNDIVEDYTNPNIHYSDPETICFQCKIKENAKPGDWLQDEQGNYYEK